MVFLIRHGWKGRGDLCMFMVAFCQGMLKNSPRIKRIRNIKSFFLCRQTVPVAFCLVYSKEHFGVYQGIPLPTLAFWIAVITLWFLMCLESHSVFRYIHSRFSQLQFLSVVLTVNRIFLNMLVRYRYLSAYCD